MIGNAHCVNPLSHALRRASSPERGSFLCGGKVCLLGSYPFRLLPLVAATLPLLSLRDIFPRPGEVGPQGDGFSGGGKVSCCA